MFDQFEDDKNDATGMEDQFHTAIEEKEQEDEQSPKEEKIPVSLDNLVDQ